ncbi:MAG: hypothetical protein QOG26_85, partial [Solirubrobacterales bacterium]|nr:hypothetical protein [Solirubrobacterales bacterium]
MISLSTQASGPQAMGALRAQRLLETIGCLIGPAIAASLVAIGHLGRLSDVALFGAATLIAGSWLERARQPLHLLAFSGVWLWALPPLGGAVVAGAVCEAEGVPGAAGSLALAVAMAWLVFLLGAWVTVRFKDERQIRLAVIGTADYADSLAADLGNSHLHGYALAGRIDPQGGDCGEEAALEPDGGVPGEPGARGEVSRIGSLADLRQIVRSHGIDLLVIALKPGPQRSEAAETVVGECWDLPVRMIDGTQFCEKTLGYVPLGAADSAWFHYLMHPSYTAGWSLSKRAFDLGFALMLAVLSAPLLAVAALAIKLHDGGPILHRQRRVGEGGREFTMVKLRSMLPDAERDGAPVWCRSDDERVTPVGRVLRRTHIDELPQLWNVLRGEMTMVGPRPERPQLVTELEGQFRYYERRHLMKPGLTGWAQVRCGYAGSDRGSAWKLCHDLYYLKHRSIWFDLLIVAETLRATVAEVQT